METESLGASLRRLRLARDLTLESLAELSTVSGRTISDIERGVSLGPQRRTLQLLADALELTDDDRSALMAAARAGRARASVGRAGAGRRCRGASLTSPDACPSRRRSPRI